MTNEKNENNETISNNNKLDEAIERASERAFTLWNDERLPGGQYAHLFDKLKHRLQSEAPTLEHLAHHYINNDRDNIALYQRVRVVAVAGNPRVVTIGSGPMVGDWFAIHKGIEKMAGGISYQRFPYIPYGKTKIERTGRFITFTWSTEPLVIDENDTMLKKDDAYILIVEIMD